MGEEAAKAPVVAEAHEVDTFRKHENYLIVWQKITAGDESYVS
jgi:hypothetical protein